VSTGTTPAFVPEGSPQRRVPRYTLTVPLNLTVLRSGIPDNVPGRTLEIGEGGMGVVVGSRLLVGESVRIEFLLPHMTSPVRATAVVRYQHERSFGLQFLRLPVEQQSIIRYWTRCEGEILLGTQEPRVVPAAADLEEQAPTFSPLFDSPVFDSSPPDSPLLDFENLEEPQRRSRIRRIARLAVLIVVIAAMLGWWRWQQEWNQLEAQVRAKETAVVKPRLEVPPEAMQQRISHQVMPEYPEDARNAGVQGTVLLDAVVSAEGIVTQVKFVSGPKELSLAAIDAVRWWRYEPYLVNGQPATVETTIAVNFRLTN
jgi:TonB family protein